MFPTIPRKKCKSSFVIPENNMLELHQFYLSSDISFNLKLKHFIRNIRKPKAQNPMMSNTRTYGRIEK